MGKHKVEEINFDEENADALEYKHPGERFQSDDGEYEDWEYDMGFYQTVICWYCSTPTRVNNEDNTCEQCGKANQLPNT